MMKQVLDCLCELYSMLGEEDMWTGVWLDRCIFPDTAKAITYEQQGFFEQAQVSECFFYSTRTCDIILSYDVVDLRKFTGASSRFS